MATTLWDKFQAAVRWARGTTDAAIAVISGAPAQQTPHLLIDASAAAAAPTLATHGASIEGYRTVNLSYAHSDVGATSAVQIHLHDGVGWYPFGDPLALGKAREALGPLDTEGWSRIALEITTAPGAGTLTSSVFPHNEATP